MPRIAATDRPQQKHHQHSTEPFPGFENLSANFVYCPNQFFDVCLPNYSRGVVRLVSYMLRRTLGWLDKNGDPVEQRIEVSYRELIAAAGLSRGAIRKAIDEAIAAGFIVCDRPPQPSTNRQAGQIAHYMLRWETGDSYISDAETFGGFFRGEGYRTPIPNTFFDVVVPTESLAVVKVVGAVLRHTVGYQNQFGGRRSSAPLSYSYLQRYIKISDRSTLAGAVHQARDAGYIRCVENGCFGTKRELRRAATYAVKWLAEAIPAQTSSKSRPVPIQEADQFKNQTDTGSKSRPLDRFKNQTKEKTQKKDIRKQQPAVAARNLNACVLLQEAGFDEATAKRLAGANPIAKIQQQISWLEKRNAHTNRLGLLRRAIEENWSEPIGKQDTNHTVRDREQREQEKHTIEAERAVKLLEQTQQRRSQRVLAWRNLPAKRQAAYYADAIKHASSATVRTRLLRCRNLDMPTTEVLAVMAADCDSR